jgi:hypothetical protein
MAKDEPDQFKDDFQMRRQGLARDADATLRLQQISTLFIREGATARYTSTYSTLPLI